MPTLARESSRPTRSKPASSSPPAREPASKTNGVASRNYLEDSASTKDPKLFDLYAETGCKLCDQTGFQPGSDSLVRHYALEHFREQLDSEVVDKDNICLNCRTKKLKSRFDTRLEFLVHNASFHYRAQILLAGALGVDPNDPSAKNHKIPNYTRARSRTKEKILEGSDGRGDGEPGDGHHNGIDDSRDDSDNSSDEEWEEPAEVCNTNTYNLYFDPKHAVSTKYLHFQVEELSSSPQKPIACQLCQSKMATRTKLKRHGIDKHFARSIQENLPQQPPFNCPESKCSYETDSLHSLTRHAGVKHRAVDQFMSQLMGDAKVDMLKVDTSDIKKKELWVVDRKSTSKNETWFVNKECTNNRTSENNDDPSDDERNGDGDESGNETETESQDSNDSKKLSLGILRKYKNDHLQTPRTFAEFEQALRENLRTKDGAYCKAKDEKNIECVCGKVIKVCNTYYWRYMVQKPRIQGGKIISRGHWFNCDEVKRRGTDFVMEPREIEELEQLLVRRDTAQPGSKRPECEDREEMQNPKRIRVSERQRERLERDGGQGSEDEEETRQMIIQRNILDLLESRVPGETFIQDAPCFLAASNLSWCRECKKIPQREREEIILAGKFQEDESNITCCFYSFRKLRMTPTPRGEHHLAVAGYLNPNTDPRQEEVARWQPDPDRPAPAETDIEKTKYILGLIGDQFCQMVQQERKCLTVHLGANKNIAWKKSVKGVREMCDICKTTLFNYHWICGACGMFVCLDCYQYRRGGLVRDTTDTDRFTDDYKWPYCNTGAQHLIGNLMLATIIPRSCLIDLAKKVHSLRVKWKLPQFCHQAEELASLYAQDDGFLSLQSVSVALTALHWIAVKLYPMYFTTNNLSDYRCRQYNGLLIVQFPRRAGQ